MIIKQSMRKKLSELDEFLYGKFQESFEIANVEWLPAVSPSGGSYNSLPHLLNVEKKIDEILFIPENITCHKIELNAAELYILLSAILFHDIGKTNEKCEFHAKTSGYYIEENWSHLRIASEPFSRIIANIARCHVAWYDEDRSDAISTVETVEHYGNIRVKMLAVLLFLGDRLDGARNRIEPGYIFGCPGTIEDCPEKHNHKLPNSKFKREFRLKISDNTVDIKNKMACTAVDYSYKEIFTKIIKSIPKRSIQPDCSIQPDYSIQKNYFEIAAKEENRKQFDEIFDKIKKIKKETENINIDPETEDFFRKIIKAVDYKGDLEKLRADIKCFFIILNNLLENNNDLKKIKNELKQINIPLEKWLLDCGGILYEVEDKDEEIIISKTFEPALKKDYSKEYNGYLEQVFEAMRELSSGIFGNPYHSYEQLLNSLQEPYENIQHVQTAVRRLEKMSGDKCKSAKANKNYNIPNIHKNVIYWDDRQWALFSKTKNKQS